METQKTTSPAEQSPLSEKNIWNQMEQHSQFDSPNQQEDSITHMDSFIKNKYAQVNDLQQFLLKELQEIENNKHKHKLVQKIIVSTLLPTVHQLKNTLATLTALLQPYHFLTVNYVEAVSEKCKDILKEKQRETDQQHNEIDRLKKEIQSLKNELQQTRNNHLSLTEATNKQQKQDNIPSIYQKNTNSTPYLLHQASSQKQLSALKQKSQILTYSLIPSPNDKTHLEKHRSNSKSPTTINKYEEYYRNILENKKTNNVYRLEKSPDFKHPTPSTQSLLHQNSSPFALTADRKEYIKQKIEKIKNKQENRTPHKTKLR